MLRILCLLILFSTSQNILATELLTNRGFETGDTSGWIEDAGQGNVITVSVNDFSPNAALSGSFFFSASVSDGTIGGTPEVSLSQEINVSSFASQISNGSASITAQGFALGKPVENSLDTAHIVVEFYQGGRTGSLLSSQATNPLIPEKGDWREMNISSTAVPINTDTIVFRAVTSLDLGFSSIDVALDDLSLNLFTGNAVPEPTSFIFLLMGVLTIAHFHPKAAKI